MNPREPHARERLVPIDDEIENVATVASERLVDPVDVGGEGIASPTRLGPREPRNVKSGVRRCGIRDASRRFQISE